MAKSRTTKRRRTGWHRLSLAEWLSLLGLSLMALKAGLELAKAIISMFQ